MIAALALLGAIVLAAIAILHVRWALRGDGPASVAIPTGPDGAPVISPGPLAGMAVAALLLTAAFLLLERGGWGPGWLPTPWRSIGTTGVATALGIRAIGDFRYVGFWKRYRDTPFARMDTRVYTPLVAALSLLAGAVALFGG